MKSYNVWVEFRDFMDVEAESREEAEEKAIAIMRSQGGIIEWVAAADGGKEITE